jgi:hypothetical protein
VTLYAFNDACNSVARGTGNSTDAIYNSFPSAMVQVNFQIK